MCKGSGTDIFCYNNCHSKLWSIYIQVIKVNALSFDLFFHLIPEWHVSIINHATLILLRQLSETHYF